MPTIRVQGMHCQNCKNAVTKAIAGVSGTTAVDVNLEKAEATWQDADPAAPVAVEQVKKAINSIGFDTP